MIVDLLVSH